MLSLERSHFHNYWRLLTGPFSCHLVIFIFIVNVNVDITHYKYFNVCATKTLTVATGRRTEKAMPQTCASKCAAPCFTLTSEHLKQFALCRRHVCCVWQQLSPNFFPAPLGWLKARHISFPLVNLEEYSQAMISSSSWCRGQILCLLCFRTLFHLITISFVTQTVQIILFCSVNEAY